MNIKSILIQKNIERLGGIRKQDFVTAAGESADTKVELDLLTEQNLQNRLLRQLIIGELAMRLVKHEPDIIVPIPTGADHLGTGIGSRLYLPVAYLEKQDITPGNESIQPKTDNDRQLLESAGRIALVDDVFTTGGSLMRASRMEIMEDKQIVAAAEVWDRSDGSYQDTIPFEVESIVEKYVPLRSEWS